MRGLGCVIVALGLTGLGGLAWQLWGTGVITAGAQQDAAQQMVGPSTAEGPGDATFRIRIPALGVDQVVFEGVDDAALAKGPGRYPRTALPGEPGNVGVAGHRVTHGGPFGRLDELAPCDEIVLEGRTRTWTYRVLPVDDQANPCGLPAGVPGIQIVAPERDDVLRPVGDRRLLTLTTCHPKYSARQRLIVHAELVATASRNS